MAGTLADIRQEFVKISRRYDLIDDGDLTANVDNGANYFINRGQRWLDTHVEHPDQLRVHHANLFTGQRVLWIQNLISVVELTQTSPGNAIADLTRKRLSLPEFRSKYPDNLEEQVGGTPANWLFMPIGLSPERLTQSYQADEAAGLLEVRELFRNTASTELLDIPTALAGVTEWTDLTGGGSPFTRTWGWAFGASPGEILSIPLALPLDIGRDYTLSINITDNSISAATTFQVKIAGVTTDFAPADTGTKTINFTAKDSTGLTFQVPVPLAGNTAELTISETDPVADFLTIAENISGTDHTRRGILIAPKADMDYTIRILGRFFHDELSADGDQSYWTLNYPDLLAMAAAQEAEKRLGSKQRLQYYRDAVEHTIFEIDREKTMEQMDGYEAADFMGRAGP